MKVRELILELEKIDNKELEVEIYCQIEIKSVEIGKVIFSENDNRIFIEECE